MRFKFKNFKVNQSALIKATTSQLRKSPQAKRKAKEILTDRAVEAKKELLNTFEEHPITKEIEAGSANTSNYSRTLQGLPNGKGSLFGFIGFAESDKPIDIVRFYLTKIGKISATAKTTTKKNKVFFEHTVKTPDISEIEALTPMPWEGGRSWIRGIERGISGLGYYLLTNSKASRSGQGVQLSNQLRTATYRPTKYMSNIIKNYVNFLRTGKSVTKR